MTYTLKLHRSVEKQLRKIPPKQRERLAETMRSLVSNPRPVGTVHLDENLFRLRVGQYRVIYAIFEDRLLILVVKVARRTEATYRDLKNLSDRARKNAID